MITTNPNFSPEDLTDAEKIMATSSGSDFRVLCVADKLIKHIWENHKEDKDVSEEISLIVTDLFGERSRMNSRLRAIEINPKEDTPSLKWAEAISDEYFKKDDDATKA